MRIRNYTPADLDALRRLHAAQGFGYPFPDLESPLFITKLVLEDDGSRTSFSLSPSGDSAGTDSAEARSTEVGREVASANSPPEHCREEDRRKNNSPQESPQQHANPSRIRMAVLLRLTAEAYLLHDATAGTPRQRWQNLLALHEAVRQDALARGLDDVQAFLPPGVERAFGRRLNRLGWRQDPWTCFSREVVGGRC